MTRRMQDLQSPFADGQFVAIDQLSINLGSIDGGKAQKHLQADSDPRQKVQILLAQTELRASSFTQCIGRKDVIEVRVCRDHRYQLQTFRFQTCKDRVGIPTRIDDHSLHRGGISHDVAVTTQRPHSQLVEKDQAHRMSVRAWQNRRMAAPVIIETSIDIRASRGQVWEHLVDWENLGRWMTEGSNFEVLGDQREGVGAKAKAKIKILGISTVDLIEVLRWEPPSTLEIGHRGWVSGTGLIKCFKSANGCQVYWRETLLPPWGPMGAAGLRIFRPVMKRIFARDLGLLKSLCE